MDIIRPAAPGPHPAVVAIHGGGFRAGNRYGYRALCIKLAQRGYVAATISYRLAPRHQFPSAVEDAKAAVRFLRANAEKYGVDPNHIGVTGGSAGGHLALMVGLTGPLKVFEGSGPNPDQSSAVQAVVNYYGPVDFTESYGKSVDAHVVLPMFLGGDLWNNRREHVLASPLHYVTPLAPPVLSVHGTEDKFVAYEHAVWITSRLITAGALAELETIPGAGHGFKGADAERAEARLLGFFDQHLKPARQTRILISDHGPKGEVVAMLWPSGEELWRVPNERGHDVQSLPGGNVLYTVGPKGKVIEIDTRRQKVWECCEGLAHPLAAQRLPNGNTLIGDARAGRVIEVDRAGKIVWTYASDDIANMRMRNSRRTASGTTIIAVEADARLIEVDREGKIVWQWQAPEGSKRRLYQGRRLANGNTLVSLSDPGELVEVDRQGKVLRSVGGASGELRFGWVSGVEVLPGGNLLINDYTGRRIVEVDEKGKIVHQLRLGARTVASMSVVE
jgi:acetyl esterase/lipase